MSALIQQGLAATVPAWLVLIIAVFAVFLGYLFGRRPHALTPVVTPVAQSYAFKTPLQVIDFNYQDSPLSHGWEITERVKEGEPVLTHTSDGFFGNALKIRATDKYAMECGVVPAAYIGKLVEFATKVEGGSGIYANLSVQSKDGTKTKDVWLNFQIGVEQPRPYGDGKTEWTVYLSPEPVGKSWLKFQVDLNDALIRSFGKDGWVFRKLRGFRLRGNLEIAYIKVY